MAMNTKVQTPATSTGITGLTPTQVLIGTIAQTPRLPSDHWYQYGITVLGLTNTPDALAWDWFDFDQGSSGTDAPGFLVSKVAGGTVATYMGAASGARGGGTYSWTTSATGSSSVSGLILNPWVYPMDTAKWWMPIAFKLSTTPDAQTTALIGLQGYSGKTYMFGVVGGTSTTNFVIQHGATHAGTITATASVINATWNVAELWSMGDGKIYGRVNGGATVSATYGSVSTEYGGPEIFIANGTTAAAQTLHTDFIGCLSVR
jgi:hypothetical protein